MWLCLLLVIISRRACAGTGMAFPYRNLGLVVEDKPTELSCTNIIMHMCMYMYMYKAATLTYFNVIPTTLVRVLFWHAIPISSFN